MEDRARRRVALAMAVGLAACSRTASEQSAAASPSSTVPVTTEAPVPDETVPLPEPEPELPEYERWFRTLADDAAGGEAWASAFMKIVQRERFSRDLEGERLAGREDPSVTELVSRRVMELSEPDEASWGCKMALRLRTWESAAALPVLQVQTKIALAAWAADSDRERIGPCLADVFLARRVRKDEQAFDEYGRWISGLSPGDMEAGDRTNDRWRDIFEPLTRYPDRPSMQAAAHALFGRDDSPWLPLMFPSGLGGSKATYLHTFTGASFDPHLLKVAAFRERVRKELTNKRKVGTFEVSDKGYVTYKGEIRAYSNEAGGDDKYYGRTGTLRYCDALAQNLSFLGGTPYDTRFETYWSRGKRDAAIAKFRRLLKDAPSNR